MKRTATVLLLWCCLTGTARATSFVVAHGGTHDSTTCKTGSDCAPSTADSIARPGDALFYRDGTYNFPTPLNSGVGPNMIRYVGDPDTTWGPTVTTANVVLYPQLADLAAKRLSFNGFKFLGQFTAADADSDSVSYCVMAAGTSIKNADDWVLYRCLQETGNFWFSTADGYRTGCTYNAGYDSTERNSVVECSINAIGGAGDNVFEMSLFVDGNVLRNRMYVAKTVQSNAQLMEFHDFKRNNVWGNHIRFYTPLAPNGGDCTWDPKFAFALRDYSRYNWFLRDTLIVDPASAKCLQIMPSSGGNCAGQATCAHNRYTHCKIVNPKGGIFWQDGFDMDSVSYSVLAASGQAMFLGGGAKGPAVVDHCTILGQSYGGAVNLDPLVSDADGTNPDSMVFTNNIVRVNGTGSLDNTDVAMFWWLPVTGGRERSNYNLYWPGSASDSTHCVATPRGGPGAGTAWTTASGEDLQSHWGDPGLADATLSEALDVRPSCTSRAVGLGTNGTTIGCDQCACDLLQPGQVTNLTALGIEDDYVLLQWTAPGDDGAVGTATAYDTRYVAGRWLTDYQFGVQKPLGLAGGALVAKSQWELGTQVTEHAPSVAGTVDTLSVGGLAAGTLYTFALATVDDCGKRSVLSPVLWVQTSDVAAGAPGVQGGGGRKKD